MALPNVYRGVFISWGFVVAVLWSNSCRIMMCEDRSNVTMELEECGWHPEQTVTLPCVPFHPATSGPLQRGVGRGGFLWRLQMVFWSPLDQLLLVMFVLFALHQKSDSNNNPVCSFVTIIHFLKDGGGLTLVNEAVAAARLSFPNLDQLCFLPEHKS